MSVLQLGFLGIFLGLAGCLLKMTFTRRWTIENVVSYLAGALIFGIFSAIFLHPIQDIVRLHLLFIIAMSYMGADMFHRLLSSRG